MAAQAAQAEARMTSDGNRIISYARFMSAQPSDSPFQLPSDQRQMEQQLSALAATEPDGIGQNQTRTKQTAVASFENPQPKPPINP